MDQAEKDQLGGSIYAAVDEIFRPGENIDDLLQRVREKIYTHGQSVPNPLVPRSILESRFTPAQEAYDKGMLSCGAVANISASMLRHLGYQVKLVHGETLDSVDHAWISVLDKDKGTWQQYDLTRENGEVTPRHKAKLICDNWEDIREQIEEDHNNWPERFEVWKLNKKAAPKI